MNILFLTLIAFNSLEERNIYTDLLREFVKEGHSVFAISPIEKRKQQETHLVKEKGATILRLKTGNSQKSNIIEKGLSIVMIESIFRKAIKEYFSSVKFDLVLYSTPPITLVSAVEYVKRRDQAKTYLLLKDIFPQNAVDIGMLSKSGAKGMIYRHFRSKEKKLYSVSDFIGCMSPANVKYILDHNPELDPARVEVLANSIEVIDKSMNPAEKEAVRIRYELPTDKTVFVYGGNLGKAQGIPFFLECLKACRDLDRAFFLIIGDGTEYDMLNHFIETEHPANMRLMKSLPKADYDTMVGACDAGLLFLDHRFTIPNFPSRMLSYMAARLPILAATDPSTDVGQIIAEGGFGWACESNDPAGFRLATEEALKADLQRMGEKAWEYLNLNYTAEQSYRTIRKRIG